MEPSFLAREPGIAQPYVQLYGVGIEVEPFLERLECGFVFAVIVQTMGALVVLFGAEERGRHISTDLV